MQYTLVMFLFNTMEIDQKHKYTRKENGMYIRTFKIQMPNQIKTITHERTHPPTILRGWTEQTHTAPASWTLLVGSEFKLLLLLSLLRGGYMGLIGMDWAVGNCCVPTYLSL